MMSEIKSKSPKDVVCVILISVVFIIAFITFVLTPFTYDLRVLLAGSNQSNYIGKNLIYDAYKTWDLKGVFLRVSLYTLYKVSILFTQFGTFTFERTVNIVYAVFVVFISSISVFLTSKEGAIQKNVLKSMLLACAFFMSDAVSHIQAEMTCVLILIFGFSLYINAQQTRKHESLKLLLAGCCIGSIFFLKSALLVLSVAFVAAAYLWDENNERRPNVKKLFLLVIGSVVVLLVGTLSILAIAPREFQNILDASVYQSTLLSGGHFSLGTLKTFLANYFYATMRFPVLAIGTVVTIFNATDCFKKKAYFSFFMHFILYFMPAFFVILSNKFFPYHYFVFAFSSVIEILLYYQISIEANSFISTNPKHALCILIAFVLSVVLSLFGVVFETESPLIYILVIFVLYLLAVFFAIFSFDKAYKVKPVLLTASFMFSIFIYAMFISVFSKNYKAYISLTKKAYDANQKFNEIDFGDPVLFLDDGTGAYVTGAPSYLKYYYPLPIQRISENSQHSDLASRVEALRQIDDYTGEYICVYESWIFMNANNQSIKDKIANEYEKTDEIIRYGILHNLFLHDTEKEFIKLSFYTRKQ